MRQCLRAIYQLQIDHGLLRKRASIYNTEFFSLFKYPFVRNRKKGTIYDWAAEDISLIFRQISIHNTYPNSTPSQGRLSSEFRLMPPFGPYLRGG